MSDDKKWFLKWSGCKDTEALRQAVKHCETFPLFKDSEAKLINHEDYMKLVEADEIDEPKSYWQISKEKIGLIALSYYRSYSDTWERIDICKSDFLDGWQACKKSHK